MGGGLDRLNRKSGRFDHFLHDPENPNSISGDHVLTILEDRSGFLWIGTRQTGLNRYDSVNDRWKRFYYDAEKPDGNSIRHNTVTTIYEDSLNNLWVGTGRGIERYDKRNNTWTYYSTSEGLAGSLVYGIMEDNDSKLWLSTDRGISRFNPQTNRFRNYNIKDGLQEWAFNPGARFMSPNGEMFFGGPNGFNSFHPQQVKDNSFRPPVVLTGLSSLNKQAFSDKLIPTPGRITMSTDDRYISFEFAALCFADPEKNQYAYMLEGRDTSWVYQGTDRRVTLVNLKKGEYILRIKASNNHGVWNEDGFSIEIGVSRPFWKETWFALIAIATIAALVTFSALKFRKKRPLLQAWNEEELKNIFTNFKITNREQEILWLLVQGKRNEDISRELYISHHTVRNHVHSIYQKLNIQNRLQLIKLIQKKTKPGRETADPLIR